MVAGRQLEDIKHELIELRERKVHEGVGMSEIGAGSQKFQTSSYKVSPWDIVHSMWISIYVKS